MIISLIIVCMIVLYSFGMTIFEKNISLKKYLIMVGIFSCAYLYIVYLFNPTSSVSMMNNYKGAVWDLSRYYLDINTVKKQELGQVVEASKSASEPLRIILWWFIGNLLSEKWVQVISSLCTVCTVVYTTIICAKDKKSIKVCDVFLTFLLLFAAIGFWGMVNSCRNLIAFFLAVIGISKIYNRRQVLLGYVIVIIAALLHVSCWSVLIMILAEKFLRPLGDKKIILVIWRGAVNIISSILCKVPVSFISVVGMKLQKEVSNHEKITFNRCIYYIIIWVFGLTIFYIIGNLKKVVNDIKRVHLLDFIQVMIVILLGSWSANIISRLLSLVVMLSPCYVIDNNELSFNLRRVSLSLLILVISAFGLMTYLFLSGVLTYQLAGSYFG